MDDAASLRSGERSMQQFQRIHGEKAHVFNPVIEPRLQRTGDFNSMLTNKRDTGVTRRIAIAIAARP